MVKVKEIEKSVLKAFQEENPSIYYSDKNLNDYRKWKNKMDNYYRMQINFPPEMFANKDLLDFGAGTGENTV